MTVKVVVPCLLRRATIFGLGVGNNWFGLGLHFWLGGCQQIVWASSLFFGFCGWQSQIISNIFLNIDHFKIKNIVDDFRHFFLNFDF